MPFTKRDPLGELCESSLASIFVDDAAPLRAVLIIGMDHFKALNDTFGHALGDEVLDLVGQRLQSAIREQDRLFRLAGDEFAILLNPVQSAYDAGIIADRFTALVERAYLVRGQVVNTSACIGIVLTGDGGTHPGTLLKRAGMALRSAKLSGPGAVELFEMGLENRMMAHHALAIDLRKALLLRQLEVHYQPQVDIGIQHLTGFEALLRWRHPELGWISPGEFIPLAEETGLIGMIGDWVLRIACLEAARLPKDITIAVNASPVQFKGGALLASVERALSASAIPASRLEIEITEGVLLQNSKAVLSTLDELHSMGVRLAMDDFGTGYSSLGQLAKFPFDTIKIDRSLVGKSAKQRAIVRAITTLGSGLGISTLVEGIETEDQLLNAYSDGCKSAQGYLFGKAVPASELEGVLARSSRRLQKLPHDSELQPS